MGWIGRQIKIEPAPPFQPMTHQNLEQQEFPTKQQQFLQTADEKSGLTPVEICHGAKVFSPPLKQTDGTKHIGRYPWIPNAYFTCPIVYIYSLVLHISRFVLEDMLYFVLFPQK